MPSIGHPIKLTFDKNTLPCFRQVPAFATLLSPDDPNPKTIYSASLIVEDLDNCNPTVYLALVSATTGAVTPWVGAAKGKNGWRHSDKPDGTSATDGGSLITNPCQLKGNLRIPADFGKVGALLVRLVWPNGGSGATPDKSIYLESLLLQDTSTKEESVIPIHSYLFDEQFTRVFFSAQGYITQNTPAALAPYRAADLEVTQGLRSAISEDGSAPPVEPYTSKDRIYDYDVYNDLGGDPKVPDFQRPILGGAALPYPRRIKTGRPLVPGTENESKPKTSQPYLPKNELFTSIRQQGFGGNVFKNVALSAISVIGTLGRSGTDFSGYQEVYNWFKANTAASMEDTPGAAAITASRHSGFKWPSPAVANGRPDMWRSDEEFGRQVLAGQNPVTVNALRSLDGTAFSSKSVPRELTGGTPLEELVAEAAKDLDSCHVFQLNYTKVFDDYIEKVANTHTNRVLYGIRCLLFSNSQGKLLPVAVELTRKKGETPEVFTRLDGPGIWTLAKLFVAANDSSTHQVVSHWLRTHASVEAFIIATRRHLSLAHPINRLLQKHTTYTLQINSLARVALVNAGGIIERAFSPGNFSMEMGAKVYEAGWTFENQALPNDLVARGMAVEDSSAPYAGVRVLKSIADYPFATDGLQLWAILENWVSDYVNLYYEDDKQVLGDAEIVAWWEDVQTKAHPDIKKGWPVLDGRVSLARILTTIIYVASAHHAAVNFGQYDFSGLLLNRSSKIRKEFPEKGSAEYKLLAAGADYDKIEKDVLSYLAGPVDYATVLSVIEVLSGHDDKEAYLGAPDAWVLDEAAKQRYSKFAEDLAAFEKDIAARNRNAEMINRCGDYVVPYTLLIPSSKGGVTRRGVPNSISI
jgi:Lipoxygenase